MLAKLFDTVMMKETAFLFLAPLCLFAAPPKQPEYSSGYHPKSMAYGKSMMVVSANPLASEAGFAILKQGGNAIDAAIAMQMVLNVVEPQSSGIGGGGFLLYYRKEDNSICAYDGREIAPRAVHDLLFCDAKGEAIPFANAILGGKAVGVPGLLKMLEQAHRDRGRLPWKELFQSAIRHADQGFPISYRLHQLIANRSDLSTFPEAGNYFFQKNGKPKPEGTLLKNSQLAETLTMIANQGTDPFYKGDLAQEIVKTVQKCGVNPGVLSYEDLSGYYPIKREPIQADYRHYRIVSFPPPSGGGIAVLQILGMLQHDDLKHEEAGSAAFIHLFSQASALAFTDRNYYVADPDFFPVPTDRLIHPAYLQQRGQSIDKEKASPASHGTWPSQTITCFPCVRPSCTHEYPSTSHLCVVDNEGNAVSMTTSIEHAFGSTLMVRGFFLNNQLTDFSFIPEKEGKKAANRVEPGKRPMSSMAPILVFHKDSGQLLLAIGSGGGAGIIDYTAQALLGIIDFGLTIQEAIDLPHVVATDTSTTLEEKTVLHKKRKQLEQMGHRIKEKSLNSGTHGIHAASTRLMGGADPRREGKAIGQ
ncbi:MAG: gamma-glutamyltransferase [Waddliaceae bacterium]